MPKVSVIIPTFNRAGLIARAIRSVTVQHYRDFEILVIDDGSTDETEEVARSFGKKIRYCFKENEGAGRARNYGLLKARGEYIAFLDSDDLWLPEKLSLQVTLLDRSRQTGLVYTDIKSFSELGTSEKSYFQYTKPYSGYIFRQLFMKNFIPTSTVMVRRHCFEKVGIFKKDQPHAEDYDMWLRIASSFQIQCLFRSLSRFYLNPEGLGKDIGINYFYQGKLLEEAMHAYSDLVKDFVPQARSRLGDVHYLAGRHLFEESKNIMAFKEFMSSVRWDPSRGMACAFLFSFPVLMAGRPIWRRLFKGKLLSILV